MFFLAPLDGTIFLMEEYVGTQTPYISLSQSCDLRKRSGSCVRLFTLNPIEELLRYETLPFSGEHCDSNHQYWACWVI